MGEKSGPPTTLLFFRFSLMFALRALPISRASSNLSTALQYHWTRVRLQDPTGKWWPSEEGLSQPEGSSKELCGATWQQLLRRQRLDHGLSGADIHDPKAPPRTATQSTSHTTMNSTDRHSNVSTTSSVAGDPRGIAPLAVARWNLIIDRVPMVSRPRTLSEIPFSLYVPLSRNTDSVGYWISDWISLIVDRYPLVDEDGNGIAYDSNDGAVKSSRRKVPNATRMVLKVCRDLQDDSSVRIRPYLWVKLSKGGGMLTDILPLEMLERFRLYTDVTVCHFVLYQS